MSEKKPSEKAAFEIERQWAIEEFANASPEDVAAVIAEQTRCDSLSEQLRIAEEASTFHARRAHDLNQKNTELAGQCVEAQNQLSQSLRERDHAKAELAQATELFKAIKSAQQFCQSTGRDCTAEDCPQKNHGGIARVCPRPMPGEIGTLRQSIAEIIQRFKHNHIRGMGQNPDKCERCGLDLRHEIHNRL